jgi:predicted GNAT family acetyltransferase
VSATTIRHLEEPSSGAFLLERDGAQIGELFYTYDDPQQITIEHTEVDESLRGSGLGVKLVEAAIEWARGSKKRVRATCPFARRVLRRRQDLRDVYSPR